MASWLLLDGGLASVVQGGSDDQGNTACWRQLRAYQWTPDSIGGLSKTVAVRHEHAGNPAQLIPDRAERTPHPFADYPIRGLA